MLLHVSKHFQGFLVNILYVCVCSIAQLCLTLWTPWIVAHQAPLSMGFSTQEYCGVGSHFLFQTIFLTQGSNPRLLHLLPWQADSLSLYHLGNLVHIYVYQSVQLLSCVQLFATPWTAAHQASLSITNSQGLLKLMSIKLGMPGDAIQSSHPLSSPSYSAFSLSQPHGLGLFQWVSSLHWVAKVLEFKLHHQSFQCIYEYTYSKNIF